ncbi:MAG: ABC transporter substrate-binding protein [Firmicutes bacterium]|nr:ABC transporter substrate-binding protein [Bacillota bacterium]
MKMKTIKKIAAGILSFSLIFSLAACGGGGNGGSADGGEKTKLYVVNWKDYGSDDAEFVKAFEEANNCEIVNTYMDSEEDLLTRLKTSGEGEIDVCLPNCTILPAAISGGYLEEIDTSKIANFNDLFDRFKTQEECFGDDGKMYAVPFVWGSTALAYNTNDFDKAPDTIAVLFDEKYKGKITFRDDYNDAIMTAALVLGQDPNNPSDLNAVKELLIKQKALNRTYWQTGDEFSKLFVSGNISVGLMWSGQAATMKQEGEPISFTVPADGAIGWVDNWAIPAKSQNKELAYKFINAMLDKDFQHRWASGGGPAPANQAAAEMVDPEYAASAGMDEESLGRLVFMKYRSDDVKKAWNELWTEVKTA